MTPSWFQAPPPGMASARQMISGGAAADPHLLQRLVGEERDVLAVRRPEWREPALGSGNHAGVQRVQRPQPEHALAFGPQSRKREKTAIGRDRGRSRIAGVFGRRHRKSEDRSRGPLVQVRAPPLWRWPLAPAPPPQSPPQAPSQPEAGSTANRRTAGDERVAAGRGERSPAGPLGPATGPRGCRFRASAMRCERPARQFQFDHRVLYALAAAGWIFLEASGDHPFHGRMDRRFRPQ